MHTLHVLRHAKSSWDDQSLADHERPLSPRGVRDARRMSEYLSTLDVPPDVVLCSSAVRTQQTLGLIASSLGDAVVYIEDSLYEAPVDDLLARLQGLPEAAGSALVIGHNPGLQELVLGMSAAGPLRDAVSVKFPTCAVASLALGDRTWAGAHRGDAELVAYTIPKDLS
jgi:phosphohistidine phosphatase